MEEAGTTALLDEMADLLAPAERIPSADWCDAHTWLPPLSSPLPGRWRTLPYQRGVFEAFDDPAIEEITLCWGTQLGKTALWIQLLCYVSEVDPSPIIVACPDHQSAVNMAKTRLYPALEACPLTAPRLLPERLRDMEHVDLSRMYVKMTWSGSDARLGESAARYLFLTELDKWSKRAGREGDPAALILERTKAFYRFKVLRECSPSVEGLSRIWTEYLRSDRRTFHVPCPRCSCYQALVMGTSEPGTPGLKWEKDAAGKSDPDLARSTAWYECAGCHGRITDSDRPTMLRRGVWVPARGAARHLPEGAELAEGEHEHATADPAWRVAVKRPPGQRRRAGFHLSSLYSPFLTFGQVAERFLVSQARGVRELQAFLNGWLAEPWRETGTAPEWQHVRARCATSEPRGAVPEGAEFLTGGADLQADRLYFVVRAWARDLTSWLIDFGELQDLQALDALLEAEYEGADGQPRIIQRLLVDSGYETGQVYDWCAAHGDRCMPVKGQATWRSPFTYSRVDVHPRTGRQYLGGLRLVHVDSGFFKGDIHHRLRTIGVDEPGAFQVCGGASEDYYRQLCGESQVRRRDPRGYDHLVWLVTDSSVGNHYLDAEVYAYAAAYTLGLGMRGRRALPGPRRRLSDVQRQRTR